MCWYDIGCFLCATVGVIAACILTKHTWLNSMTKHAFYILYHLNLYLNWPPLILGLFSSFPQVLIWLMRQINLFTFIWIQMLYFYLNLVTVNKVSGQILVEANWEGYEEVPTLKIYWLLIIFFLLFLCILNELDIIIAENFLVHILFNKLLLVRI